MFSLRVKRPHMLNQAIPIQAEPFVFCSNGRTNNQLVQNRHGCPIFLLLWFAGDFHIGNKLAMIDLAWVALRVPVAEIHHPGIAITGHPTVCQG